MSFEFLVELFDFVVGLRVLCFGEGPTRESFGEVFGVFRERQRETYSGLLVFGASKHDGTNILLF